MMNPMPWSSGGLPSYVTAVFRTCINCIASVRLHHTKIICLLPSTAVVSLLIEQQIGRHLMPTLQLSETATSFIVNDISIHEDSSSGMQKSVIDFAA